MCILDGQSLHNLILPKAVTKLFASPVVGHLRLGNRVSVAVSFRCNYQQCAVVADIDLSLIHI